MKILLNTPDDLLRRIDHYAASVNQSRTAVIIQTLADRFESDIDPDVILGYVQVRNGDLEADADCDICGQPMKEVFCGVTAAGRVFGPVCQLCATQD